MIKRIIILSVFFILTSAAQEFTRSYNFAYELRDAKVDSSLDNNIRYNFVDDDGSNSLKSISVDLNNDGIDEKLIPNEFLCGSGGCPWLVYSLNMKKVIGEIFGIVLYIDTKQKNGYKVIETYSRNGGGKGTVSFYEYLKGHYNSVNRVDLKGEQIKEYFNNKKALKK